ncbi:Hypothetical predicted protein [Mytilus galloprovincialis]|uniref:Uncharacterized protein n=1 Tax=Mytilus galloprovincialis TaxID=29158 RepID=A0A8B6DI56_MYTGA|nr:Hypothetical predicted protein [Mytilus galloprovincialis]
MHHTSICRGKEVIPGTTLEHTTQQSSVNKVETPNETRVMYSSQQNHNILLKTAIAPVVYNDQEVECMIVTKRRPFEENIKGSDYLPRPPERTHPQLVESRSHIDTGQKLIMKEIYS